MVDVVVSGRQANTRLAGTVWVVRDQGVGSRPAIQSKKSAWLVSATSIKPRASEQIVMILRVEFMRWFPLRDKARSPGDTRAQQDCDTSCLIFMTRIVKQFVVLNLDLVVVYVCFDRAACNAEGELSATGLLWEE
jgi:hypothetical protein